jgi:Ca-activated chloride channel family protein
MLFHRPSALIVATLLIGCARSEAPLEADLVGYDAPIERVQTQVADVANVRDVQVAGTSEQYIEVDVEATTVLDDVQADGEADAMAIGGLYGAEEDEGGVRGRRETVNRPVRAESLQNPPSAVPTFVQPSPASAPHPEPPVTTGTSRAHPTSPPPPRDHYSFSTRHTEELEQLAPGSEDYTHYGVNGFTNPEVDDLSTFAVDVDTASYAVTRRKLREGYLPPPAAVRVEEFVNYFQYDYEQPERGYPFAVDFEAAPSPFNARNHLVRVGVQGKTIDMNERKPVHLTFLVDVSGSMRSSDKIGLLKQSLTMLTNELDDGDTVAIATYAGSTRIVLQPTPIRQSDRIMAALEGLSAGGSTAMSSGIDLAYQLADRTFVSGDVNRVIVCSDGDANVGSISHTQMSEQIRGYAERGITLTTLGFGNGNYQDTLMERLANDGDGNYFYIDSAAEARRVLVDKLTSTLEVIAKDVKIQVQWDPTQVLAYRLIGYENRDIADRDFRNDAVDAGEIGAGHQVTALYEVALADGAHGDIATVRIRNKAPGPDSPAVERTYAMGAKTVGSSFGLASDQFRIAVAATGFAEVLRGSPHMSEVSMRQVLSIAQDAQRVEYSEDAELVELIERAAKLRGEGALVQR